MLHVAACKAWSTNHAALGIGFLVSKSSDCRSRGAAVFLACVLLAGIFSGLLAAIPTDGLRWISERLGHAEDFTAERVLRFRLLTAGLGATWALVALAGLTLGRSFVERAIVALCRVPAVRGRLAPKRSPGVYFVLLVVCLLTGAGLRLWHLDQPIKYDEAYTYLHYARRPLYQGLVDYGTPNNHLLHTLLSHLSLRLLGDREWTLRIPAFLAGLLAIGATYRLGKQIAVPSLAKMHGDGAVGLLAAAMMAASASQISYSANARGYTLVTWLGLVLAGRMACVVRHGRAFDWLLAGVAAVLGFFTIPTMLFSFVGVLGWALWRVASGRACQARRAGMVKLAGFAGGVGLVTLTLYAPALAFSGLEALRHDVLRTHDARQLPGRLASAWWDAIDSWSDGIAPVWLLVPLALAGPVVGITGRAGLTGAAETDRSTSPNLVGRPQGGASPAYASSHDARHAHASVGMAPRAPRDGVALWLAVFAATAVLTLLARQVPPPRVFTFLAPYFYLFVAAGLLACVRGIGSMLPNHPQAIRTFAAPVLMLLILVRGGAYVASGRIFEHTETGACRAARPAAAWLAEHASDADRVLAPLGCDVPILYYLVCSRLAIAWMGESVAGETVFLLTPNDSSPAESRDDPVLAPLVHGVKFGPWHQAARFEAGSLWKSVVSGTRTDTSGARSTATQ